ncbi:MAG: efflux RND transporter permease subunit [Saprospiraceae bacterium]|nr:efflux RND transporter permease subunit [Saprospiraceae bacterium]
MVLKNHSFSIILLSTALALTGLLFIPYISLNLNPTHRYPSVTVQTGYINATPEEVEKKITRPIEGVLTTLSGISKMYSTSRKERSTITLELQSWVNTEMFRFQVLTILRQIHQSLPDQAGFPSLLINKPDEEKSFDQILTYSIFAPLECEAIYDYAVNILSPLLSGIDGLYKIHVTGGSKKEYIIEYNQDLLKSHHITPEKLGTHIKATLRNIPIGQIDENGQQWRVSMKPAEMDNIAAIPIKIDNHLYRGGSLFKVYEREEKPMAMYRIDGKNNIRISFIPDDGANHLQLGKKIKDAIGKISLPSNFEILKEYDTTEYIQSELDKIKERTLYSVLILLAFVFLAYRKWKHIFVVISGMLISLGVSFILYYVAAVQLNLYSLAAITISLGIVIDNIIVMVDHFRKYQNFQIIPAILSATGTTLSALVVFWFLPIEWQWNLSDFAKVLFINLSVSIGVAFIFIPAMMYQLNYRVVSSTFADDSNISSKGQLYKKWLNFSVRYKNVIMAVMILIFGLPLFMLPVHHKTSSLYNKTIGSDWYLEYARPILNKYLGGTLRLFSEYVYTRGSFRSIEETKLYVNAYLPLGSTLNQTNELMKKVEHYIKQYSSEIKNYTTDIRDHQNGSIEISFHKNASESFPHTLKNRLVSFCIGLGEVEWNIYGVGKGFSNLSYENSSQFTAELRGYNLDHLKKLEDDFAKLLELHPRIEQVKRNINLNWGEKKDQQYLLSLDFRKMSEKNVDLLSLSEFLHQNNQWPNTLSYTKDNKAIRIQKDDLRDNDIWDVKNTYHSYATSTYLVSEFSKIDKQFTLPTLHKENQQYIRRCGWTYIGNEKYGQQFQDESIRKFEKVIPVGYTIKNVKNNFWSKNKNQQYWYITLIPLMIFVICSIQFESIFWGHPNHFNHSHVVHWYFYYVLLF